MAAATASLTEPVSSAATAGGDGEGDEHGLTVTAVAQRSVSTFRHIRATSTTWNPISSLIPTM
jgi:hypothetical protein